jgi:hypothetical protein
MPSRPWHAHPRRAADRVINWLLHSSGVDDGSGAWYLWWSGFFSNVAIFAAFFVALRRLNCHEPHCWRIGRFPVVGTPYHTCTKHHPVIGGGAGKRDRRKGDIGKAHDLAVAQGRAGDHNVQTVHEPKAKKKAATK